MNEPRVVSVRAGRARTMDRPDWDKSRSRTWTSAYMKDEVAGPARVTTLGLEGDEQVDKRDHGGSHMAVLMYAAAHYALWRAELGIEAMGPGGFAENLTVEGLDERAVCIGDVFASDQLRVQVSQPRGPCNNISRRWNRPDMVKLATDTARIGWYLRVLAEGTIERGAALTRVERPQPGWTVERVFRLRLEPQMDAAALPVLAAMPELSPAWRGEFAQKAAREVS